MAFPTSGSTAEGFPVEDTPADNDTTHSEAPVAFPTAADSSAPVAFPGSETSSQLGSPAMGGQASPGVTFQDAPTTGRAGTPDVDQDGKRRRTLSTQGMQRLARRISISGRRQGSTSSIPSAILNSFKRDSTTLSREVPKDKDAAAPKDGLVVREDGTIVAPDAGTSPSGSVASDLNQAKDKKKQKKMKKRKSTGPA